jgi:hypothetical protein
MLLTGCPGPTDPISDPTLEKPVIAGVESGDELLTVTWGAVSKADNYDVYYHTADNPEDDATVKQENITGTTATITGLTNNTLYYVWVKAKNSDGSSDFSQSKSGTPAVTIPAELDHYFQSLPWGVAYAYYDDGFAVDASTKTFYYYQDSTFDTKWGGPIAKIVSEGDAYIMIVNVTEVTGSWYTPPETGKYFAAAYKNPTAFAVSSCTAYKSTDGKNTGVATIGEAVSEYTVANGYFNSLNTLYYPHDDATATTLASLQGKWVTEDLSGDPDYFIQIRGTKLTEWYDDGDGIYDTTNDSGNLGELGDIVDHTDTSQASGVLYVKIIDGGFVFTADKYIVVAWNDKADSGIKFHTNGGAGNAGYNTLAEVKAAFNDISSFDPDDFYGYTK